MIGVEEEFFVCDRETLFPISYTPKLILKLLGKNSYYLRRSSMESPIHRELFKAGFPIIELKTAPHAEIDCLMEELKHHRGMLKDVAEDEGLLIMPSGLHPAYDAKKDSRVLCCAFHVHVSGYPLKKAFLALMKHIPELIAVTANSPFLNGKVCGKAMRTLYSYAIGVPTLLYKQTSDVFINRKLQTVELRVCDTQIVSRHVFDFVQLIMGVVDSHCRMEKTGNELRQNLERKRHMAAIGGRLALHKELKRLYEKVSPSLDQFGTTKTVREYLMSGFSPADFQIEVAKEHGIACVPESLWASFQKDELTVSNRIGKIQRDCTIKPKNLPYLLLYLPVHVHCVIGKFIRDDVMKTWLLQRHDARSKGSKRDRSA